MTIKDHVDPGTKVPFDIVEKITPDFIDSLVADETIDPFTKTKLITHIVALSLAKSYFTSQDVDGDLVNKLRLAISDIYSKVTGYSMGRLVNERAYEALDYLVTERATSKHLRSLVKQYEIAQYGLAAYSEAKPISR